MTTPKTTGDITLHCLRAISELDTARKAAVSDYDKRMGMLKRFLDRVVHGEDHSEGDLMPTAVTLPPEIADLIADPLRGL